MRGQRAASHSHRHERPETGAAFPDLNTPQGRFDCGAVGRGDEADGQGSGGGVSVDGGVDAEGGFDGVGREHLLGRAFGQYLPLGQEDEAVAETGGEVEVVDGGDGGEAAVDELADEGEDLELMEDVEVGGRLVEQQDARLLGDGAGEEDALAFRRRKAFRGFARRMNRSRSGAWRAWRCGRPPCLRPGSVRGADSDP